MASMSQRYVPRPDDGWDETRETIDGFTTVEASFYPGRYPEPYKYPVRYEGPSQDSFEHMAPSLSPFEVTDLVRSVVEKGRQETQRSLAGNEGISEAVELKLTIDLGHQNIQTIPDEVVNIIKDEVARLSISHNQIWHVPYKFSECTKLTYVNLRYNLLKEFPKALLHLSQLQILDLSRNKLQRLPEDIGSIVALRVLSVQHNRLETLPLCLADLTTLQILKVAGNPLMTPLKRVAEGREGDPIPNALTDNERDAFLTTNIKIYLKLSAIPSRSETESGGESSEGPLDTPRPVLKRGLSGRFPVIPSTSGSESASDARSPSLSRPPPVPSRSHYRIASGQNAVLQNAALRRPGLAPLTIGNERNRSNSESILQATQATQAIRNKRMGIITKKQTNLTTVDESRTNRLSHYRGLSYGSALHGKHSNGVKGNVNSSSSPVSSTENERQRPTVVKRLSSLPEHRRESSSTDEVVEAAKGVLYSLFQVDPHIKSLLSVARDGASKRTSLERVYYNASTHVEELDKELHIFEVSFDEEDEERSVSNEAVQRACATCIMAYQHVCALLLQNIGNLIQNGDPRYVRTLLLLVYGSLVEARNACSSLGLNVKAVQEAKFRQRKPDTIHEEDTRRRDRSLTPTRVRPNPGMRLRSDTTIQHATYYSHYALSGTGTPAVPLYVNGRSRSNSRTNTLTSSTASSVANTPRSGESFGLPSTPYTAYTTSRSNTMQGYEDSESEAMFEKIFISLTCAYEHALKGIPLVHRHVSRCLEVALETHTTKELCAFWKHLVDTCHAAIDVSGALKLRLSNIRLKDPGLRNQREFWQLCTAFTKSLVEVLMGVKRGKELDILPADVIQLLRPVQASVKEAGKLINSSPWSYLAADNAPVHDAYHHSSNSSSPYVTSMPPTPLSAALGPAAQATVPTTPASSYGDRFFSGDVFQRADSLLASQQHTMHYRR